MASVMKRRAIFDESASSWAPFCQAHEQALFVDMSCVPLCGSQVTGWMEERNIYVIKKNANKKKGEK